MSIIERARIKGLSMIDGWTNILTGLNTSRDARTAARVTWNKMSEIELENLYSGSKLARKIVDLPVKSALKNGYKITGVEKEQEQAIKEHAQKLKFEERVMEAAIKSRLYGGSAILKTYNDSNDLQKSNTPRSELKGLIVFNRFELWTEWSYIQKDILSPEFRMPMLYRFQGRESDIHANLLIHHTRLSRFEGELLPDRLKEQNSYWHDSFIAPLYEAIRNYYDSHDGVSAAIKDLSIAIFKIKNLSDMIASDCDDKVQKRLELVNLTKSILKAVALDSDGEDFRYETRSLTGVGELVSKVEDRLTAESEIPSTILYGHSPSGGLGQTGDHDTNNWFNYLVGMQDRVLRPPMLDILKEVAEDIGIKPEKIGIEFEPLDTPSEKEVVELRKSQAEIDDKYSAMGVLDPSEIRSSRFGGQQYSIETTLDESTDIRSSGLEQEKEILMQLLKQKENENNGES